MTNLPPHLNQGGVDISAQLAEIIASSKESSAKMDALTAKLSGVENAIVNIDSRVSTLEGVVAQLAAASSAPTASQATATPAPQPTATPATTATAQGLDPNTLLLLLALQKQQDEKKGGFVQALGDGLHETAAAVGNLLTAVVNTVTLGAAKR